MIKSFKELYWSYQFNPRFWGRFINPFYFARKGLYQSIQELAPNVFGSLLDVGCGRKPYEHLFSVQEYVGLEIDTPETRWMNKADFFYDGGSFPFPPGRFDCVLLSQVFEHVFNPDAFLTEVSRVLKPSGSILITVPFAWDEHEQPFDYARYSSFGIRHLLERNGFRIVEQKKSVNDIRTIFQLFLVYLYKSTVCRWKLLNLLITIIFFAPLNLAGDFLSFITPKNDDLYLDNIVLAEKIIDA